MGNKLKHNNHYIKNNKGFSLKGIPGAGPSPAPSDMPDFSIKFKFIDDKEIDPRILNVPGEWKYFQDEPNCWLWVYNYPNWCGVFENKLTSSFCKNISIIKVGNTSKLKNAARMFAFCTGLTSIDSFFNTENILNMNNMFAYCDNLTSFSDNIIYTTQCKDLSFMFYGCKKLINPQFNNNTSNCENFEGMFANCESLQLNNIEFDINKSINLKGMFAGCTSLTTIPTLNFDETDMIDIFIRQYNQCFQCCHSLTGGMTDFYYKHIDNRDKLHTNCFSFAGDNNSSGQNDRKNVPQDWGGDGN